MERNIKTWKVYIHINKINNKKYIGITSENDPNKRWKNGLGYKKQIFYNAIQKYGWNNFQHKILYQNLTEMEAKQKEVELIAFYKTNNNLYGYNQTRGGDAVPEKNIKLKLKISQTLKNYYQTTEGKNKENKLVRDKNNIIKHMTIHLKVKNIQKKLKK